MHLTEERVQELENKLATARTLQVRRPPQPRAACHSWPCPHRKSSSALLVLLNAEQGHALDVSTSALKCARLRRNVCSAVAPGSGRAEPAEGEGEGGQRPDSQGAAVDD